MSGHRVAAYEPRETERAARLACQGGTTPASQRVRGALEQPRDATVMMGGFETAKPMISLRPTLSQSYLSMKFWFPTTQAVFVETTVSH